MLRVASMSVLVDNKNFIPLVQLRVANLDDITTLSFGSLDYPSTETSCAKINSAC